jgi:hypothetical protein
VPKIAYLCQGQLFLLGDNGVPVEVTSQFGRDFEERQSKQRQVNGWKEHSGVWGNMGFTPPQFQQWQQAAGSQRLIRFLSVDRGPVAGQLSYLLGLGRVTGLFSYETAPDLESRLFHRNDFVAADLTQHGKLGTYAMSVTQSDATKHIVVADPDGRFPRDITAGDTVDEQPRWADDSARRLVYQSASLMRNQAGFAVGLSPYSIQSVDLDRQSIDEVLASDDYDYLQPDARPDGSLYFIRRPYKQRHERTSIWTDLQDVLLFPFRFLRAVFYFLNFFSMMFSGRPLRTAGGPERPDAPNTRLVMLWGQMIDTRKKMFDRSSRDESAGLVPRDWELIHRTKDGQETVLQTGILAYNVDDAGNVVSTDGRRIYLQKPGREAQELAKDRFIERVVLLADAAESSPAPASAAKSESARGN